MTVLDQVQSTSFFVFDSLPARPTAVNEKDGCNEFATLPTRFGRNELPYTLQAVFVALCGTLCRFLVTSLSPCGRLGLPGRFVCQHADWVGRKGCKQQR